MTVHEVGSIGDPPEARSGGISYQELLDTDTHKVPDVLRMVSPYFVGSHDVDATRYTSRAFHELEKEKLWKKVWQLACREEDIPEIGDMIPYDICDLSFLVVRADDGSIKAYWNACLHRGRLLREYQDNCHEIRCPFHGFCWNLDGTLKSVPAKWDFPHVEPDEFSLHEVKVGTWGGFVFINPDPDCGSLADHLVGLDEQFARWPLAKRYKQAHVAKIVRANWKVVQEAFMEAFHVVATHPQILPGIGDENTQYDVWGNLSRAITPNGTPSPHLKYEPTEQQMIDSMVDRRLDEEPVVVIAANATARATAAANSRELYRPIIGDAVDEFCDAEFTDSMYYTVFPNFHPWGGFNRIMYRFRPYGDEHEMAIMECMFLAPYDETKPRPRSAPIHWLGADDDWTEAPELASLARVFNQDIFNLPKVQRGLHSLTQVKRGVTLANYQETKVRHFETLLDQWLGTDGKVPPDKVTIRPR
jgi:phenylpropionate dioxygenase-like ring-hydroxylating dioxygenase large terminal subunit